jgi:hypothetical protein
MQSDGSSVNSFAFFGRLASLLGRLLLFGRRIALFRKLITLFGRLATLGRRIALGKFIALLGRACCSLNNDVAKELPTKNVF